MQKFALFNSPVARTGRRAHGPQAAANKLLRALAILLPTARCGITRHYMTHGAHMMRPGAAITGSSRRKYFREAKDHRPRQRAGKLYGLNVNHWTPAGKTLHGMSPCITESNQMLTFRTGIGQPEWHRASTAVIALARSACSRGRARGCAGHAGARTPSRRHRAARGASWRAHGGAVPGRCAGRWRSSCPRVTEEASGTGP